MDYRVNCRQFIALYFMFLKHSDQNRFAQTASIGVRRAFAPCAEDIASAHSPAVHKLCGVIKVGRRLRARDLDIGASEPYSEPYGGVEPVGMESRTPLGVS